MFPWSSAPELQPEMLLPNCMNAGPTLISPLSEQLVSNNLVKAIETLWSDKAIEERLIRAGPSDNHLAVNNESYGVTTLWLPSLLVHPLTP